MKKFVKDLAVKITQTMFCEHDPYFLQQHKVGVICEDRISHLVKLCQGKSVLHIGCADWPIFKAENNLHLKLMPVCKSLAGMDISEDRLVALRNACPANSKFIAVPDQDFYDLVLVPEVLEHVSDYTSFFKMLEAIHFSELYLTVPDAYSARHMNFKYDQETKLFTEAVHPDHNAWFSPATLTQLVQKHSDMVVQDLHFFNGISLLARITKGTSSRD